MKIYVHFIDKRSPVRLFNISVIRDYGNHTVVVDNAFGGQTQKFEGVHHVAVEPEAPVEDEE